MTDRSLQKHLEPAAPGPSTAPEESAHVTLLAARLRRGARLLEQGTIRKAAREIATALHELVDEGILEVQVRPGGTIEASTGPRAAPGPSGARASRSAPEAEPGPDRPRVFLAQDMHFFRQSLARALREANLRVVLRPEDMNTLETLCVLSPVPDLLILPIQGNDPATLELVREIRATPGLQRVPILGVSSLDRSGLDFEELRRLGVKGLVDKRAIPEQVVFRVNQVLKPRADTHRRRFRRAPTYMPVDLVVGDGVRSEYALNVSCGGMLVTSAEPLEPNTDLKVRFRLPASGDEFIEASGRVVYQQPGRDASAPYLLGLFFYPLAERDHEVVAREVERILGE